MLKFIRRRQVIEQNDLLTPAEAKAIALSLPDDPRVAALASNYIRLVQDRAEVALRDRARLANLLRANMGERGPNDWGVGYYEGMEDAVSIVQDGHDR